MSFYREPQPGIKITVCDMNGNEIPDPPPRPENSYSMSMEDRDSVRTEIVDGKDAREAVNRVLHKYGNSIIIKNIIQVHSVTDSELAKYEIDYNNYQNEYSRRQNINFSRGNAYGNIERKC